MATGTFEEMNHAMRVGRTLSGRGEWAEAEAAYERARDLATSLGAAHAAQTAEALRAVAECAVRDRLARLGEE